MNRLTSRARIRLFAPQRRACQRAIGLSAGLALVVLAVPGTHAPLAAASPPPAPGTILTVAGTGQAGFSGDGGPAAQAKLSGPFGVALDKAGNLYFSDRGSVTADGGSVVGPENQRIREAVGVGVPR